MTRILWKMNSSWVKIWVNLVNTNGLLRQARDLAYTKQNCSENVVVNIEICEKRPLPPSLTTHTSQLFYTLS